MKKTHLYFITSILLALFTFAISSCSDDDDVETSTMIVEIDSESNLFNDLTGSLEPGMWVREEGKRIGTSGLKIVLKVFRLRKVITLNYK